MAPGDPLQALIQLIDPPQQIVRAPEPGKLPEASTLEGDEEGIGEERQDQAYLLVINLFNQSQLSPQARQTLFAQLGQPLESQPAGQPGAAASSQARGWWFCYRNVPAASTQPSRP